MMMKRGFFAIFLSTLLIAGGLARSGQAHFVMPADIDATEMLPAPPADESAENKAEIQQLRQIESQRTPADVARAQADAAEKDIFIFKTVLGDGFNAKALPLTAALSAHVEEDELADIEPVKQVFNRTRPYQFDKTLHPVCPATAKKDSYPSGHAMSGYLEALTLASMLPEEKDAIFARADDYAHNRLVCGVHHASDIEASKKIAYALFALMADNAGFKAERNAAEAELRKALSAKVSSDASNGR
jgi:acid phosphatase (class A)